MEQIFGIPNSQQFMNFLPSTSPNTDGGGFFTPQALIDNNNFNSGFAAMRQDLNTRMRQEELDFRRETEMLKYMKDMQKSMFKGLQDDATSMYQNGGFNPAYEAERQLLLTQQEGMNTLMEDLGNMHGVGRRGLTTGSMAEMAASINQKMGQHKLQQLENVDYHRRANTNKEMTQRKADAYTTVQNAKKGEELYVDEIGLKEDFWDDYEAYRQGSSDSPPDYSSFSGQDYVVNKTEADAFFKEGITHAIDLVSENPQLTDSEFMTRVYGEDVPLIINKPLQNPPKVAKEILYKAALSDPNFVKYARMVSGKIVDDGTEERAMTTEETIEDMVGSAVDLHYKNNAVESIAKRGMDQINTTTTAIAQRQDDERAIAIAEEKARLAQEKSDNAAANQQKTAKVKAGLRGKRTTSSGKKAKNTSLNTTDYEAYRSEIIKEFGTKDQASAKATDLLTKFENNTITYTQNQPILTTSVTPGAVYGTNTEVVSRELGEAVPDDVIYDIRQIKGINGKNTSFTDLVTESDRYVYTWDDANNRVLVVDTDITERTLKRSEQDGDTNVVGFIPAENITAQPTPTPTPTAATSTNAESDDDLF